MHDVIQKLVVEPKGILAADESNISMEKRFAQIGLVSTPDLRKDFRQLMFETDGIENYIGGVILYQESVEQGLHKIIESKNILWGIKVDGGLEDFNGGFEQITMGLDGLEKKVFEFKNQGASFCKWRAVFQISDLYPSQALIDENINRMVEYVKTVQSAGLVAIVEPEVLYQGNHTNARCEEVTTKVLKTLFTKLIEANVDLSNLILKTSMVLPGKDSGVVVMPLEVSNATLRSLVNTVPSQVPAIVFLSGGQSPDQAIDNLDQIEKLKKQGNYPWEISFSYARALQSEAMQIWAGNMQNKNAAQEAFLKRLKLVSKARTGELK